MKQKRAVSSEIKKEGKVRVEEMDWVDPTVDERIEQYRSNARKKMQELNDQMDETDQRIKDFVKRFNSEEDIFYDLMKSPSSIKMFREIGFNMHCIAKGIVHKSKNPDECMYIDALLNNDKTAIVVNIESNCSKSDIDHFLQQMEKFKKAFPIYQNHEILVAIAATNFENDVDRYAHKRGLIVIRTDGYEFFSIDPCNRDTLLRF